jgi:hypothetical protein
MQRAVATAAPEHCLYMPSLALISIFLIVNDIIKGSGCERGRVANVG